MDSGQIFQSPFLKTGELNLAGKRSLLLRLIRAAQPITRTEIAQRLKIDPSTVTENTRDLINRGILREDVRDRETQTRRSRVLSYADKNEYFIGINLGVRHSQVGTTTLGGGTENEVEFETPKTPTATLSLAAEHIRKIVIDNAGKTLRFIGVSIPGMTDSTRREVIFAPNLNWRDVDVAGSFQKFVQVPVVVENDATAAAMFEARLKIGESSEGAASNFILVRSGTGIGVGMVIGSEVYRGTGLGRGVAGEFGHMTIIAGGKSCVCGNQGCWEKYASASSAASLYLGDRPLRPGQIMPRFVEIVAKAENGELRARRSLEKVGDYLGIGIANVIMGTGVPRVIISGRLVYGWKFIVEPLHEAIRRSIIGNVVGWSIEAGSPTGSALGGALEVAVEEYLNTV
ncbi:MAG TPA: ROK family transcriptional regulator [Pyrinomonadaceae bacterium]|nr:ROK family transcriptional regulator [Pyrinomonadaceae bacterium]